MIKGIIFCGHGTKSQQGLNAFFEVYTAFENKLKSQFKVSYGFVEYSQPSLSDAIEKQISEGVKDIVILPALLFSGVHVTHDIPFVIQSIIKKHPEISIKLAATLDLSEKVIELCVQLINQQLIASKGLPNNKSLLVIGVGSSQPEANIQIAALSRILWEKLAFQNVNYAFISKMTYPSVDDELSKLNILGQNDVIVFPIILFPGVYLDSIFKKLDAFKLNYIGQVKVCNSLYTSELLIDAFMHRLYETIDGKVNVLEGIEILESARK